MGTNSKHSDYLREAEELGKTGGSDFDSYLAEAERFRGTKPGVLKRAFHNALASISGKNGDLSVAEVARLMIGGAGLGFLDEIVGTVEGAVRPGMTMQEGRDKQRAIDNRIRAKQPLAAAGVEAVGAVAPALVAAPGVASALPRAGVVGRGMAEGAVLGGLFGIGNAEGGIKSRAGEGARDAAVGAAAGAVLGTAGKGIRDVRAASTAKKLIKQGASQTDEVAAEFGRRAGIGSEGKIGSAVQAAKDQIAKVSREAYAPLEAAFPSVDDAAVLRVLENRHALPAVRRVMGPEAATRKPSFVELQDIRSHLSSLGQRAAQAGDNAVARSYREAASELTTAMEQRIPGFASANAQYRAAIEAKTAFDKGLKIWNRRPEEIKDALKALSTEQAKANMRAGMAAKFYETLSRKGGKITLQQVQRLESAGMKSQLRQMFNTAEQYNAFMGELTKQRQILMAPHDLARINSDWKPAVKVAKVAAGGAAAGAGYFGARSLFD